MLHGDMCKCAHMRASTNESIFIGLPENKNKIEGIIGFFLMGQMVEGLIP